MGESDTREGISRFLTRNPGLSFVATDQGRVVGAALAGHDGRRGYIYHLAVHEARRGRGVARDLVRHCLRALSSEGISKCHLFVFAANTVGIEFWRRVGWTERVELKVMSQALGRPTP